jgi:hypothetical protein
MCIFMHDVRECERVTDALLSCVHLQGFLFFLFVDLTSYLVTRPINCGASGAAHERARTPPCPNPLQRGMGPGALQTRRGKRCPAKTRTMMWMQGATVPSLKKTREKNPRELTFHFHPRNITLISLLQCAVHSAHDAPSLVPHPCTAAECMAFNAAKICLLVVSCIAR